MIKTVTKPQAVEIGNLCAKLGIDPSDCTYIWGQIEPNRFVRFLSGTTACLKYYPASQAEEMLDRMPDWIDGSMLTINPNPNGWSVSYSDLAHRTRIIFKHKSLSEAVGDMFIWLLKSKLINF